MISVANTAQKIYRIYKLGDQLYNKFLYEVNKKKEMYKKLEKWRQIYF